MNISYSKVELYNQCPRKYYFKYIEKWEVNKTHSALLFGSAIDRALNYILSRKKRNKKIYIETAKSLFLNTMNQWKQQNEFVFFKNELPVEQYIEDDPEGNQIRCWENLCLVGNLMIDTYVDEILPTFKKIISVQTKKLIKNEVDDVLVLITDFRAELHDGRIVTFDNKTSSDIKRNYNKNSVKNSNQLAIYSEYEESKWAGYIALSKVLKDGKVQWTCVVDTIPEENVHNTFERIDEALRAIKRKEFDKNEKNCYAYGKLCDYASLCRYNNPEGLIKKNV